MKTTEKKHWLNGVQRRVNYMRHGLTDGYFWTCCFRIGTVGVMISGRPLEIDIFRLT